MLNPPLPNPHPRRRAGRAAGFTLVELVIGLALVAVLASLAAPSMARMLANHRVRSAAQDLLDALQHARAEALRRSTAVSFQLVDGGPGWRISQLAPALKLEEQSGAAGVVVESADGATAVTFLSNGLRGPGLQLTRLDIKSMLPDTDSRRLNVHGGGLIRLCDPAVSADNDPRRC